MAGTRTRKAWLMHAALAASLAMVLIGSSSSVARAGDDNDGEWVDTKLMRMFMKVMGLKDGTEPEIDYRERAPLVVPPSLDLPAPQADSTVKSANWPVDPDVERTRKQRAAEAKARKTSGAANLEASMKPVSPAELEKGRIARQGAFKPYNDGDLGRKPANADKGATDIFSSLWAKVGPQKPETGTFTSEPPRTTMIDPPAGLQTPSSSQPYGIGTMEDGRVAAAKRDMEKAKDRGALNP